MTNQRDIQKLLDKVEKITREKKLDLSSGEDLSIGIMNLIGIEEHLFFTAQKTGKREYLDLLNEIRTMRVELMKQIIKDYEGEVYCISKHLLAASMRLMEVGTKELKKGHDPEHRRRAWDLFEKAYKLYSLFWGINLKVVKIPNLPAQAGDKILMTNDKNQKTKIASVFDKLGTLIQKALNCCRE